MSLPHVNLRKRALTLLVASFVVVDLLVLRLFWVQVVDSGALGAGALEMRRRTVPVTAGRGSILDARGRVLAVSVDAQSIYANPAGIADPGRTAAMLARVLHLPAAVLRTVLSRHTMFVWLARRVDDGVANAVRRLQLAGIHLLPEPERVYPAGELAAQVLGFTGLDGQGLDGVELYYDRELRGHPGRAVGVYDARGHRIQSAGTRFLAPTPGLTLQLTLDARLEAVAEQELDKAMVATGARAGNILEMDPKTGAILALANRPAFDPNRWWAYPRATWANPIVADAFSPGSVFKPITAAAALNAGLVSPETPFVDSGWLAVPGAVIHNWNDQGLGLTTFQRGFEESANTIFARVGLMVGMRRFYAYLHDFGIGQRTDVDLPGEAWGLVPRQTQARPVDLAVMAFGQTLTVTPIGMLAALSAIANGGELMWPHLARAWLDARGNVLQVVKPRVVRRVLPARTAATIASLMVRVVDRGTGRAARVPGYDVAGKTGTAQEVVGGTLSNQAVIASFAGFAPAEDPRLAIYVLLDRPRGVHYGGVVAAPVFAAVMARSLRYLNVPPGRPG